MTREEAIKMLEYIKHIGNGESEYKNDAQAIAIDMAIKALSEPTIPSLIEKIHDAIDNAEPDTYIENPLFYGYGLTKEHVHEIIDKAVKECTHE